MEEQSQYISPREYAKQTGLSEATVWRYINTGKLQKHQPGGKNCRVLIPKCALEAVGPSTEEYSERKGRMESKSSATHRHPNKNTARRSGREPAWKKRR